MSQRASDHVSEQRLIQLVHLVSEESCASNAPYSVIPGGAKSAAECAPLDEAAALSSALKALKKFHADSKLPVFMSPHEVGAILLLGASLVHGKPQEDAPGALAAALISSAHEKIFPGGSKFSQRTVDALGTALNAPLSIEDHVTLSAHFRAVFNEAHWDQSAFEHSAAWKNALRCTEREANAWSAYYYVASACGTADSDPEFVERTLRRVTGFSGGIRGTNNPAVNKLSQRIQASSALKNVDSEFASAVQSVLTQAYEESTKN